MLESTRELEVIRRLEELEDHDLPEELHRRFCMVLVAAFATMLAATALLNYLVNPFRRWYPELVRLCHQDTRVQKLDLLRKAAAHTQALLLGSSMSIKLSPELFRNGTGWQTFNAGVCHGVPEDLYAILRAGVERMGLAPRVVMIGIDLHSFDRRHTVAEGANAIPALSSYLPGTSGGAPSFDLLPLIGLTHTRESLRALFHSVWNPGRLDRFEADGYQTPWELFTDKREGGARAIERDVPTWTRYYRTDPGVDERHRRYFESLVDYAHARARCVVYLTPVSPRLERRLSGTTFTAVKQGVLEYVRRTCAERGVAFVDVTHPRTYGAAEDDFSDGMHIGAGSALTLTTYLASRLTEVARAVP